MASGRGTGTIITTTSSSRLGPLVIHNPPQASNSLRIQFNRLEQTPLSHCQPEPYQLTHHVQRPTILLLASHPGSLTPALRQPATASDAINRLLAMPHHCYPRSKPEGLRLGQSDQGFRIARKGRLAPNHSSCRDAIFKSHALAGPARLGDALEPHVHARAPCRVEERQCPLCQAVQATR